MQNQQVYLEEISLAEIFNALYRGKFIITAIVVVFAAVSVFIATSLPNMYKSETKLIAAADSTGGLSSLSGSLGGLASMAGLSIGGDTNEKTLIAKEMLKSRKFLASFVEKRNILIPLIAAEGVDDQGNLIINENLYSTELKQWVRNVVAPKPVIPAAEDIYYAFQKYLTVYTDNKSGITIISFEFFRADIAQQWLDWLIADINSEIKNRDMVEAKDSINYLTQLIEETDNSAMREAFYLLVEEQTKTLLLTEVREEYVFRAIDPAIFPEEKSSPQRAFICILMTVVGGILAIMFVLIKHFLFRSKQVDSVLPSSNETVLN